MKHLGKPVRNLPSRTTRKSSSKRCTTCTADGVGLGSRVPLSLSSLCRCMAAVTQAGSGLRGPPQGGGRTQDTDLIKVFTEGSLIHVLITFYMILLDVYVILVHRRFLRGVLNRFYIGVSKIY